MSKPYLIGIAGPSGSGKTTLAARVAAELGGTVLSLDSYYFDLSHQPLDVRALTNFDHPDTLESELLARHLRELREGRSIEQPVYDFATHTREARTALVRPAGFIIVEGLFTLYWEHVRSLFRTTVYVDLEDQVCYSRRLDRDIRERGRTQSCVDRQYRDTVRPMAEQFIRPTRELADIVVRGDEPLAESTRRVVAHATSRVTA